MEDFKPKSPDYAGDGVAIWKGLDRNGKIFLKVKKPEWNKAIACFKVEEKPKQKSKEIEEQF